MTRSTRSLRHAVSGAAAGVSVHGQAGTMLNVGDSMADFALRNAQRVEVTRGDLAGEIAVVAFYPMAFTGG